MDGINSYTCKCPAEYSGAFCEIAPSVGHMYQQDSSCQQHDCKHGICFQPLEPSADYICKCAAGYSGTKNFLMPLNLIGNESLQILHPNE